jgi:hypothetical protein
MVMALSKEQVQRAVGVCFGTSSDVDRTLAGQIFHPSRYVHCEYPQKIYLAVTDALRSSVMYMILHPLLP